MYSLSLYHHSRKKQNDMNTAIMSKNPQTAIKAMNNRTFMCVAPVNSKSNLVFNKTMVAVDSAGASVPKMAKFAKANGLNDSTHSIYQVCPGGTVYEYSIDKN